MHHLLNKMVAPSQKRLGIWMGGVCQLMVTRGCDLACVSCSQGSNLGGKIEVMTPEQFETAVLSLDGYFGIYGCFGGNPTVSKYFEDYCRILRSHVPFRQRGLWSNNLRGKGAHARITFDPSHSNLNVHMNKDAYDEFWETWPESRPYLKGLDTDSVHSSPWVAIKDVVLDEEERWKIISDCDVNKWWSSLVGLVPGRGLRSYFCELAYSQAVMHADDPDWPDVGLQVEPGWWRKPMADFEAQVLLHCHSCGIAMRRPGLPAITGTHEEFSKTHEFIARPKVKSRPVEIVTIGGLAERPERPSTQYLPGVTPGYKGV
jgi:hypothetical protein